MSSDGESFSHVLLYPHYDQYRPMPMRKWTIDDDNCYVTVSIGHEINKIQDIEYLLLFYQNLFALR